MKMFEVLFIESDFDKPSIHAKVLDFHLKDYQPEWPDLALEFQYKTTYNDLLQAVIL